MGASSQPTSPTAPPAFSYKSGIKDQLQGSQMLLANQVADQQYFGPQEAQNLIQQYGKIGPAITARNQQMLNSVDPESTALRKQYGQQVSHDLSFGSQLTPELEQQVQQQIRGAQSARGNISGNAPVSAEGAFKGQAALNLEQQRLGNVDSFLRAPTPEDRYGELLGGAGPAVSAQLASNVPNVGEMFSPQLGLQLAGDEYGSNLNQWAEQYNPAQAGAGNPWMRALNGASSGASFGSNFGGIYGAAIGGVAGGVEGYFKGPITQNPQLQKTLAGSGGGMMGSLGGMMGGGGGGSSTGGAGGVGTANWYGNAKGYG